MVLNTIFLVREIRRNEQHDAFINAVTHELKTPVASIRLYLQTLQNRDIDEAKRQEFYGVMLADSDRLQGTIEQVLRAGTARRETAPRQPDAASTSAPWCEECLALAGTPPSSARRTRCTATESPRRLAHRFTVLGDVEELKAAGVEPGRQRHQVFREPEVQVAVELEQADPATATLRVTDRGRRHLAGRAEADLQALLPHSRARWPRASKAPASACSSCGRWPKRHGGRVFAESDGAGAGAPSSLQLPVVAPQ